MEKIKELEKWLELDELTLETFKSVWSELEIERTEIRIEKSKIEIREEKFKQLLG